MTEYEQAIKQKVLTYIERKNDVVEENAIQTSISLDGKRLKLVEILPAIERLIAENKIERYGNKLYRLCCERNKIISKRWV